MESVAGATHLPSDYAGVLRRPVHTEISVDQKGESLLDFDTFSTKKTNRASVRDVALSSTALHDDQLTHQHENTTTSLSDQLVVVFLC